MGQGGKFSYVHALLLLTIVCFLLGVIFLVGFTALHDVNVATVGREGSFRTNNKYAQDAGLADMLAPLQREVDRLRRVEGDYNALLRQEKSATTTNEAPSIVAPVSESKGVYSNVYDVPNIVKAWREAKLDWHDLLPKHNSRWERFGDPPQGAKLRSLVSKEEQVTDYLTRFYESGLAARYGHEHGRLQSYAGCDSFADGCMIHGEGACRADQLCAWDAASGLCSPFDPAKHAGDPGSGQRCAAPKRLGNFGFEKTQEQACARYVDQPVVLLDIDSESQSMFYHWWASWTSIHERWESWALGRRDTHFFISQINDPMFFQYFGLLSDSCWRRSYNQVPPGLCFCNAEGFHSAQARSNQVGTAAQLLQHLQADSAAPPAGRAKVGVISRRRKRFILNEYELVDAIAAAGYDVELLPLETMTMYEQMVALRSVDVLVGIHGSALDNAVFMHKGSVLVQLLPYSVEHRVTFQSDAEGAGMVYMEWQLKDPSRAFFHWDLLLQANTEKYNKHSKEEILRMGQANADNRETLMFWINQDIVLPLAEVLPLLVRAVAASPARERLGAAGIAPKKTQYT